MRFTVLKSTFMNVLTPAMGTVSNKNTITAIEGVLVETLDGTTVRISTYDMNKGIRATFEAISVEREGKYIINNAQRLYQTVRSLPEGELTVDINERLNCEISCGRVNFSLFASNGADFPNLPDLIGERGFSISGETVKRMISKVSHSVAAADNRVMLTGAYFKLSGGVLEVVSCDSYTLSRCRIKCEIESITGDDSNNTYSFIIPGHALPELNKILPDSDEECIVYISRKHAIFKSEDTVFFTRTIDSEYIDYNRIIPKDNDIFIIVERERILSALERANIIAEEKIQGSGRSYVKLMTDGRYLTVKSESVTGKVCDEMECIHEGGEIEIGFNCRYLINSVKASEGDNILITLKGPTNAITIERAETEGGAENEESAAENGENDGFEYFYMILPVRMNEKHSSDK